MAADAGWHSGPFGYVYKHMPIRTAQSWAFPVIATEHVQSRTRTMEITALSPVLPAENEHVPAVAAKNEHVPAQRPRRMSMSLGLPPKR